MPIFSAYIYSVVILFGLQVGIINPAFFWWAIGGTMIFNTFFVWLATRAKLDKNFFNLLISPFLFLLAGFLFLGFSDQVIIRELVVIFLTIGATAFVRQLIILAFHKYQYKNHSLSTISKMLNTTTIFFWFSGIFDLYVFLKAPYLILIIATVVVIYFLTYQFFIITKIRSTASVWFVPVITLIMTELFLSVLWLPILSGAKALLMTSIYYFFTGVAQHFLVATLDKKVYWRYGAVVTFIWLVILITARWS
ncbi:MAG TPA: hypothetical protein P5267_02975 [Patescibacteria group bacterium]|nr:hypothetical protein [Patescibacteria group bacterium]